MTDQTPICHACKKPIEAKPLVVLEVKAAPEGVNRQVSRAFCAGIECRRKARDVEDAYYKHHGLQRRRG